ncbi:hypothetical protein [Parashewanella tropica]|uniref:hypothetical protein n=1 Tax=Parashewanella tropica TaxID=2547970 RepID=UPI00105A05C3|nr:hypothetical protein [Parashewanella tropica]
MGFFSSLFKKETPERQLNHPEQLLMGDMITLDDSFALPPHLRGQQLKVESINTYEYERSKQTEWHLKGTGNHNLYLTIDKDEEAYLAFSLKITRSEVEQLFDLDTFSEIFEESSQAVIEVNSEHQCDDLSQWLGQTYRRIKYAQQGFFHDKDYRNQQTPSDRGDEFENYFLIDDEEAHAIDIEVYDGGETDVSLILYRPISDIRQYWPAA